MSSETLENKQNFREKGIEAKVFFCNSSNFGFSKVDTLVTMFTWPNASTVQIKCCSKWKKKYLVALSSLFQKQKIHSTISISRNYLFLKSANNPQQTGSTLATLILQSTWEINSIVWWKVSIHILSSEERERGGIISWMRYWSTAQLHTLWKDSLTRPENKSHKQFE